MCCILLTFVHMYICFRGTHGRLAYIAKCAVLFKYCINKINKINILNENETIGLFSSSPR